MLSVFNYRIVEPMRASHNSVRVHPTTQSQQALQGWCAGDSGFTLAIVKVYKVMASEWGVLEVSAFQLHFQNSPPPTTTLRRVLPNVKNVLIFTLNNTLGVGSSGSEVPNRYFGKLNAHMHFVYGRRVEPTALPFSSEKTHPYFQKMCSSTMEDFFHFTRS